jgi:hypothetical protein
MKNFMTCWRPISSERATSTNSPPSIPTRDTSNATSGDGNPRGIGDQKFKAKVKAITRRTRGHSPNSVIAELQGYLRGAVNDYQLGILFGEARELDGWLRRRMRLYYWKQWGRPRTRRRKLLRLGIGRHEVHMASRSRKGHWRMSHNSLVERAMTNQWLAEQGVPSLEKQSHYTTKDECVTHWK